jgi:toxin ParE1/3/4
VASEVFFGWKAEEDLASIHRYIASRDIAAAEKFLDAIEARCQSLADFPFQGRARNDLGSGHRILFYAKRVVILYRVIEGRIEILRVLSRIVWWTGLREARPRSRQLEAAPKHAPRQCAQTARMVWTNSDHAG